MSAQEQVEKVQCEICQRTATECRSLGGHTMAIDKWRPIMEKTPRQVAESIFGGISPNELICGDELAIERVAEWLQDWMTQRERRVWLEAIGSEFFRNRYQWELDDAVDALSRQLSEVSAESDKRRVTKYVLDSFARFAVRRLHEAAIQGFVGRDPESGETVAKNSSEKRGASLPAQAEEE